MEKKIPVAVLGATGSVGQRFVQLLNGHPWFKVIALTGSERRTGHLYGEACHWILSEPMPEWAQKMVIVDSIPEATNVPLVFSALPSKYAEQIEPCFASSGVAVCTNAGSFRRSLNVPILLPEVNPEHIELIATQRHLRDWSGFIVTNPNCTSTGMTVVLNILNKAFGVRKVFAVSMQAISGAGYPGVAGLDILDNLIPFIEGEEEKLEWEPRKILGKLEKGKLIFSDIEFSVHTNRVPVRDGHTVCLSIELGGEVDVISAAEALKNYSPPEESKSLPSTPNPVIQLQTKLDRPQPRLDRMVGNGMTTVVGRLRSDPIMHLRMVVLSHNTIRGAAGGSIYNAELLVRQGYVDYSP